MWVLVFLMSLSVVMGAALVVREAQEPALVQSEANTLALNLATYRSFLLAYLRSGPPTTGTVPDSSINLPPWFVRFPDWSNLVLADGTVIVYATSTNLPSLPAELAAVSNQSIEAGVAQQRDDGSTYLYSPGHGDTGIALPTLPAGTAVWIAKLS